MAKYYCDDIFVAPLYEMDCTIKTFDSCSERGFKNYLDIMVDTSYEPIWLTRKYAIFRKLTDYSDVCFIGCSIGVKLSWFKERFPSFTQNIVIKSDATSLQTVKDFSRVYGTQ